MKLQLYLTRLRWIELTLVKYIYIEDATKASEFYKYRF